MPVNSFAFSVRSAAFSCGNSEEQLSHRLARALAPSLNAKAMQHLRYDMHPKWISSALVFISFPFSKTSVSLISDRMVLLYEEVPERKIAKKIVFHSSNLDGLEGALRRLLCVLRR